MAKQSIADLIADDVKDWIEDMSTVIADAILGSALAPEVVQPTQAEKLAYFRSKLYLPDGSPNPMGRDEILARYGAGGYQAIALALADGAPQLLEGVS